MIMRRNESAPAFTSRLARGVAVVVLVAWSSRVLAGEEANRKECEYGITLALGGQAAKAESVFISLLSHAPGSPAAFTNLGNLRLLKGDAAGALGFYERAFAADSDAGIALNQATALLMNGDEDAAQDRAHLGIQLAGGAKPAAGLLGLHYAGESETVRGAEKTALTKEEILTMIRAATGRVPVDTTHTGGASRPGSTAGKHRVQWRSAGPRAGDALAVPALVYWKR